MSEGQRPTFGRGKKDFPQVTGVSYTLCRRCSGTLQSTPDVTRGRLAKRYIVGVLIKIAAKPLQIAARLLLTADRNSSSLYSTVSSTTHYDVLFSHNTCVTDRQTD